MANEKTIRTRVQLKSDTELNWRRSVLITDHPQGLKTSGTSFVPLRGELIIFEPDSQYTYSRLKIGTGKISDNVLALPFIDAGTLNGIESIIVKADSFNNFPQVGSAGALYIDMSNNKIYHYSTKTNRYSELLNLVINTTKTNAANILQWNAGYITEAIISNHQLTITNGAIPYLNYDTKEVIGTLTMG